MKRLFVIVLAVVMCLSLIACKEKNSIIGTWECEVSVIGESVPEGESVGYLTFTDDGICRYVYYVDNEEYHVTDIEYTTDGSQLTMKYEERELTCEFSVDSDEMELTYNGNTQTLRRVGEG